MDPRWLQDVNDVHGHSAGDKVLLETARRLEQDVRAEDLVCRTGGDEFVIVVAGDLSVADQVAARIVEGMRAPIAVGATTVEVRATIGGVWIPAKTSLDELLADADALLYRRKLPARTGGTCKPKMSQPPRIDMPGRQLAMARLTEFPPLYKPFGKACASRARLASTRLQHRPENRTRFSESSMHRLKKIKAPCVQEDARRFMVRVPIFQPQPEYRPCRGE